MIKLFLFFLIAGVKTLLCKGFSLGITLLLFWLKGKRLGFCAERWDRFFLTTSSKRIERFIMGIYGTAAVLSSVCSYLLFHLAGFRRSLSLALLLFTSGLVVTGYQWQSRGKNSLEDRYQKMVDDIVKK